MVVVSKTTGTAPLAALEASVVILSSVVTKPGVKADVDETVDDDVTSGAGATVSAENGSVISSSGGGCG